MRVCTTTPMSSIDLREERAEQLLTRVPAAAGGEEEQKTVMTGTVVATLVAAKRRGCVQAQPLLACENNDADAIWPSLREAALMSSILLRRPVVDYVVVSQPMAAACMLSMSIRILLQPWKAESVMIRVSDGIQGNSSATTLLLHSS
jgi:hypothetical protein